MNNNALNIKNNPEQLKKVYLKKIVYVKVVSKDWGLKVDANAICV